jgi:DNA-binding NarL/FixJ family response regulator
LPVIDLIWADADQLISSAVGSAYTLERKICLHQKMLRSACSPHTQWLMIVDDHHTEEQIQELLNCKSHVLGMIHRQDLMSPSASLQAVSLAINQQTFVTDNVWCRNHSSKITHNSTKIHLVGLPISQLLINSINNRFEFEMGVQLTTHTNLSQFVSHLWQHADTNQQVICLGANQLCEVPNTHALDVIKMLQVCCVINYTKTDNPNHLIYVNVDEQTDLSLIKLLLSAPGLNGLSSFTQYDRDSIHNSLEAMIQGKFHIPEHIKEILDRNKCKKKSVKKSASLTPREQQILKIILSTGNPNKIIANDLKLSESAVKLHVGNILKKFNVRNRTELTVKITNTHKV